MRSDFYSLKVQQPYKITLKRYLQFDLVSLKFKPRDGYGHWKLMIATMLCKGDLPFSIKSDKNISMEVKTKLPLAEFGYYQRN